MNFGGTVRVNKYGFLIIVGVLILCLYYYAHSGRTKSEISLETQTINIRTLLIGAVESTINGGKEVLKVARNPNSLVSKSKGKTKEGANDPVTNADTLSHCAMYGSLQKSFPQLSIVSEELSDKEQCADMTALKLNPSVLDGRDSELKDYFVPVGDVTVWIDPLDATHEYTEKLYHYVSTMVCVAVKGVPIIGVVHFPFTNRTTWAWVGNIASKDLVKIKKELTVDEQDKPVVFIVSMSHAGQVASITKKAFGDSSQVISAAGAGYKVLQVLNKNATAYLHTTNIKKWDICAGNALLNYVGGRMTTISDKTIDYSNVEQVVNEEGLLATVKNHNWYVDRLKGTLFEKIDAEVNV